MYGTKKEHIDLLVHCLSVHLRFKYLKKDSSFRPFILIYSNRSIEICRSLNGSPHVLVKLSLYGESYTLRPFNSSLRTNIRSASLLQQEVRTTNSSPWINYISRFSRVSSEHAQKNMTNQPYYIVTTFLRFTIYLCIKQCIPQAQYIMILEMKQSDWSLDT